MHAKQSFKILRSQHLWFQYTERLKVSLQIQPSFSVQGVGGEGLKEFSRKRQLWALENQAYAFFRTPCTLRCCEISGLS